MFWTDVIELGIPFTDPIADGVTIQKANTVRAQRSIGLPYTYNFNSKLSKMEYRLHQSFKWSVMHERKG